MYTEEGKAYLAEEFSNKGRSTYEIAEQQNTYPNMVKRALIFHGIERRSKSQSQKIALEHGRAEHPTKGKQRSQNTRNKISDKLHQIWSAYSDDEVDELIRKRVERWKDIPPEQRKAISQNANRAVRKCAKDGSALERYLYTALLAAGFKVSFHNERVIDTNQIHIDLFLPVEGIAIEIDGPAHFFPIYGEETLAKRVSTDNKKTALLLMDGYIIIRVCDFNKHNSPARMRGFAKKLIQLIKDVAENPPTEIKDRFFQIQYGKYRSYEYGSQKVRTRINLPGIKDSINVRTSTTGDTGNIGN